MRDILGDVKKKGAELVVVGNGTAKQAKQFHEEQKMEMRLLTDPSLRTYKAAGFKKGALTVANPRSAAHAAKALLQGFVQGRTQGTATQQGGALVIDTDGTELFRYVSREAGDHPDPKSLVAALP